MPSIDFRTRNESEPSNAEVGSFLATSRDLVDSHGASAFRAHTLSQPPPLTLDVAGRAISFVPVSDHVEVVDGAFDHLVVAMDPPAFSDLVGDNASTFGLQMTGRAIVEKGEVGQFTAWEPVLRCLFDGRPAYEPGSIEFRSGDGSPLDLARSFSIDHDPDEIGHFLAEAGFLHIEGLFTEAEMAAVSADLDSAMDAADRDDGASWWARTEDGEWFPSRILGFNHNSAALRDLLQTDRFGRLGSFTDDTFTQRDPDRSDAAEGLHKKVGVVEGISDVSWHKDCSMGGHSRGCCGLTVGISVTGAGPETGELGVVAGSHRANIPQLGVEDLDLPRLPLPTRTGDVTVHCSCTLHMSRPPIAGERRVVYTGFRLDPRPGDHRPERDASDIRRDRASLNDHVRRNQSENPGAFAHESL